MAGPVEGDVASSIAFVQLDSSLLEEFGRRNYVCGFGVPAQGDYRLVFEEEQEVADLSLFAEGDQLLLQAETCGVVDDAELDDRDQILCFTDLHGFMRTKSFTTEGTEILHE